jgi:hypothetical protein
MRHQRVEPAASAPRRPVAVAATGAAIATSLCGLASILMLALLPRIIYAGYIGWADMAIWQEIWMRAPLALAVSTVVLAGLTAWGWWNDRRTGPPLWIQSALIAAALLEISLLASWHLIGLS